MADYIVAKAEEFGPGERRIVRAGKLEIGVFNVGGAYYGLPNVCAHQFGPLCEGKVTGTLVATEETRWQRAWVREGEIVTCPWHSLEFEIPTGRCLAYPRVKLRQFPVRVEDGHVIVTI